MTKALLLFFMLTVTKITRYMFSLKLNAIICISLCILNFKVIHKLYQLTPYGVTTHPVYGVSCYKKLPSLINL